MKRRFRYYLLLLLTFSLLNSQARAPVAAEPEFPVCEMSDSVMAVASGLNDILHAFGQDTILYPNEFDLPSTFPAFSQVFDLYLSDGVSDQWSKTEFADLISGIMNNDTTDTDDDIFGIVWGYFLRDDADSNAAYAGVRFSPWPGSTVYTKIVLRLYDIEDIPDPCPQGYGYVCDHYSFYNSGSNVLTINASVAAEMDAILSLGVAHELQHLCWAANGVPPYSVIYENANETMSTLAEYLTGGWRPHMWDLPYDASILRYEDCDQNSKYDVEKVWITYLYEVFKGNAADPSDDLPYRWIRSDLSPLQRMKLTGLADVLWENGDYDWVGGADAVDRLDRTFANFLVSKFCNAPDFAENGEYGTGEINTLRAFGLFLDNCTWYAGGATPLSPVDCPENPLPPSGHAGCWNVRILPPYYELTDNHENTMTAVAGIYEDGDDTANPADGDGSTDYVDVAAYGTDYIVFRAGSYYDDGLCHEFRFQLGGTAEHKSPGYGESVRIRPAGWVMGYCCDVDTPQVHPEDLVFVEPLTFSPATTLGDTVIARPVTVTDFGRSVTTVVITTTATAVDPSLWTVPLNYFVYEYEYGVYTPEAEQTISWSGDVFVTGDYDVPVDGTLEVDPGTHVKVWTSDLAKAGADTTLVEMRVQGTASIVGTGSDPVVFSAFDASGPSSDPDAWLGILVDDATGAGAEFDHVEVRNAVAGITANTDITVENSLIEHCDYYGLSVEGADSVYVWSTTIRNIGFAGVDVHDGTSLRLSRCQIDNADFYGAKAYTGAHLYADTTLVRNCDTGIYVHFEDSLYTRADIDTCTLKQNDCAIKVNSVAQVAVNACVIDSNGTGIYCLNSANITITGSVITNNGGGIPCDEYSDPKIERNRIEDNYLAVTALNGSEPDLGWGDRQSEGENFIYHSTAQHVLNLNEFLTILALNNDWNVTKQEPPECPCKPKVTKFVGDVVVCPTACGWGGEQVSGRGREGPELPKVYDLAQNHPNPFNPTTTIRYQVPPPGGLVTLAIYNVAGQLVRTVVNEVKIPGYYAPIWNGTDNRGTEVGSGIYFVRMTAPGFTKTKKMVLLK